MCEIQDAKFELIVQVNMIVNRIFPLNLNYIKQSCFIAQLKDTAWLWHFRYGHLNFGGLKILQQKNMAIGLSTFQNPFSIFEDCVIRKQNKESFPT